MLMRRGGAYTSGAIISFDASLPLDADAFRLICRLFARLFAHFDAPPRCAELVAIASHAIAKRALSLAERIFYAMRASLRCFMSMAPPPS